MAARRPALLAVLLAVAASQAFLALLAPAFGTGPRSRYEIFFTNPSTGCRSRMMVAPDEDIEQIKTRGRKLLGLDQDFLKAEDFKVYMSEDETKPLSGKISDCTEMRPWSPDGIELHLFYQP